MCYYPTSPIHTLDDLAGAEAARPLKPTFILCDRDLSALRTADHTNFLSICVGRK
jgi:hypothetical protein